MFFFYIYSIYIRHVFLVFFISTSNGIQPDFLFEEPFNAKVYIHAVGLPIAANCLEDPADGRNNQSMHRAIWDPEIVVPATT